MLGWDHSNAVKLARVVRGWKVMLPIFPMEMEINLVGPEEDKKNILTLPRDFYGAPEATNAKSTGIF